MIDPNRLSLNTHTHTPFWIDYKLKNVVEPWHIVFVIFFLLKFSTGNCARYWQNYRARGCRSIVIDWIEQFYCFYLHLNDTYCFPLTVPCSIFSLFFPFFVFTLWFALVEKSFFFRSEGAPLRFHLLLISRQITRWLHSSGIFVNAYCIYLITISMYFVCHLFPPSSSFFFSL